MKLEKALEMINKCDGHCKACKHWRMRFEEVDDQTTVYCHYCNLAMLVGCIWYG